MHELYDLKEKLMEELKEYGRKNDMTAGSLDVVDKLSHSIKNLCKIIDEYDDGYSKDGRDYYGTSYARGRGRNARRDAMGRYSSRGYSYADNEMVEQLNDLMKEAPEHIKKDIQKLITKIENM